MIVGYVAVRKALLAFAFTYHAITSAINAYSLVQLFSANAELFGAGTWLWTAAFYAPIVLQTTSGIAECALLVKIARTSSSAEELGKVGEVHLPITSPVVTRFPGEKC